MIATSVPDVPGNRRWRQLSPNWPLWPEQVPLIRPLRGLPYVEPYFGGHRLPAPPFDIDRWEWFWRTCDNAYVQSGAMPTGPVCAHPGYCYVHVGTVPAMTDQMTPVEPDPPTPDPDNPDTPDE